MTSKVPLYSSNDLKTTTDDAIPAYLTTLPDPFIQNHTKTNVRFLLGYTAVAIAGFTFYADRKLGWEATTSPWIIAAVGVYFVLNSALTYWIWGVERGEVFSGVRKGSGELISIRSSTKKHSPGYTVRVRYTDAKGRVEEKVAEGEFMRWFSKDGVFQAQAFRAWLEGQVRGLGLALGAGAGEGKKGR